MAVQTRALKRKEAPPPASNDDNRINNNLNVAKGKEKKGNEKRKGRKKRRKALGTIVDKNDQPKAKKQADKPSLAVTVDNNSYQYTGKVDDIDSNDDDPLRATAYVREIFQYHHSRERECTASYGFLENQTHITQEMHSDLIDWIIHVQYKFRLCPDTLYLAVNILNRFLEREEILSKKFKLVGATSLLIASKYEEMYYLEFEDLLPECGGLCTREEILEMEQVILKTLEHRITVPTPYTFALRTLKAAHASKRIIQLSCYLLESSLYSYELSRYLPSQLVAGAVYIARTHAGRHGWSPTLLKYTEYCEEDVIPFARAILDEYESAPDSRPAVKAKYSSKRYGEVGNTVFVRDF